MAEFSRDNHDLAQPRTPGLDTAPGYGPGLPTGDTGLPNIVKGLPKRDSGLPQVVEKSFGNPGGFASPVHESAYGDLWKRAGTSSPLAIGEAASGQKREISPLPRAAEVMPRPPASRAGYPESGTAKQDGHRLHIQLPPNRVEPQSKPGVQIPIGRIVPQPKPRVELPVKRPEQAPQAELPPHRSSMEAVPADLSAAYLHGDAKGLPPIAQDFARRGLNSLAASEAAEVGKPQVHVSTRAGDVRFALGSEQNPYTSIQSAVDHAPAGSVINVHRVGNDVYHERVAIGRSDLTVRTDSTNPAVLEPGRGAKGRGNAGFSIGSGVHDVAIKNFEIRDFTGLSAGIRVDGSSIRNITIAGNDVHGARGAEGIAVYGRGGNEQTAVGNINIVSNKVHDLKLGRLEAVPVNGNVSGFHVIGNAGYNLDNLFVDAIGGEGVAPKKELDHARGGVIEYNYADGITSRKNGGYGSASAAAFYSDGATRLDIRYNYSTGSDFGVEVGSEHEGFDSRAVHVYGNIFENSRLAWLTRGGPDAAGGGAHGNSVRDNVVIGGSGVDTQKDVSDFPVSDNQLFRHAGAVDRLPKPIAEMLRARRRP